MPPSGFCAGRPDPNELGPFYRDLATSAQKAAQSWPVASAHLLSVRGTNAGCCDGSIPNLRKAAVLCVGEIKSGLPLSGAGSVLRADSRDEARAFGLIAKEPDPCL